jgi:low affinity Fe/Cu permease
MDTRNWIELFHSFAKESAAVVGSPWAFLIAIVAVLGWIISGPTFQYSDTWQLVINTGTTIVTFLIVFLIQNSQNRDAKAIHLKLDELIHKIKGARNALIDLENCTDEDLERLQRQFEQLKRSTKSIAQKA